MSEMSDPENVETRTCTTCENPRPLPLTSQYFGKDSKREDGWHRQCRDCVNKGARDRFAKRAGRMNNQRAARAHAQNAAPANGTTGPSNGTPWPNLAAFDSAPEIDDDWTPPAPPWPDGFDIRSIGTQIDENGDTEKQWIEVGPERVTQATHVATVPDLHYLKAVSTLLGPDGKVLLQWQKTDTTKEAQVATILDVIANLAEKWPPREFPKLAPEETPDSDLLCVYPMGDPHFGMYAWAAETGDDYDLELASAYHATAIDELVRSAPPAEEALIVDLGDFFHMDDSSNETKRSGHKLDVDTRWPKVIRHGVQSMIHLVKTSLRKHKRARVWIVPGNHDDHSAVAMQLALEMFFKDEPRVFIDPNPAAAFYLHFGRNLIGATHGHTTKLNPLGEQMAADRKVEWGASDFWYWYVGHVHHDSMLETRGGVLIETMRTLAARDKYAADAGYRAQRDMKCDVIHKIDGRIHRNTVGIRQIKRRIAQASLAPSA